MKKHIVFGILAHVDAGKTTLSEGFLFAGGKIEKRGRVDKGDTCLDSYALERERGITIFSKQAEFAYKGKGFTLLDTPGHIDFSAEMERTLAVLDYAILVVSGTEGVKPHTQTVWKLLKKYEIPTFIFVNKMDASVKTEKEWLGEIREKLGTSVVALPKDLKSNGRNEEELENIAVLDEEMMEAFLETGEIEKEKIKEFIKKRLLFPCFFGSALRYEGIEEFLQNFSNYTVTPDYDETFKARVFKVSRDGNGNRLTHLKILGGTLEVKDKIGEEKVNQIRVYSGEKYEIRDRVEAGEVCTVTGLTKVFAGEGLGGLSEEKRDGEKEGVLKYQVILEEETDSLAFLPKIRELEEEIPELQVSYYEKDKKIYLSLMGEVQKEVITHIIKEKYGIEIGFGEGNIVYKETIKKPVLGFGHFEPLKHYAEVHLLMVPTKRGTGISYLSEVSEDVLSVNFQKQIFNFLKAKEHKGVLIGAGLTDVEIRLVNGRAHEKHTDGGDFREASYRAVRNGLMRGESTLLEPIYDFVLELPEDSLGRAMADFSNRKAEFGLPEVEGGVARLIGKIPVSTLRDYETTLRSYTKGEGKLSLQFSGYEDCHNTEEVLIRQAYYPEADIENTADSVFCSHGAGFVVPWNEVEHYVHLPFLEEGKEEIEEEEEILFLRYAKERESQVGRAREEEFIAHEEIDKILGQAVNSNKKKEAEGLRNRWKKKKAMSVEAPLREKSYRSVLPKDDYLLVDGYNIIFAWEELKNLAATNIDSARDRLIDILINYQGYKGNQLILVFDAYKIKGGKEHIVKQGGISVIYTKEAETADQYIAKVSLELTKEGRVSVATSDSLVQMIIFGSGAIRLSAKDLLAEVEYVKLRIQEKIEE